LFVVPPDTKDFKMKSKSILRSAIALLVTAGAFSLVASPVSAAVGVTLSQSTKLADLQVVSIKLASIPAGQGVYISQCFKPQIGQRAATGLICNGSIAEQGTMIWATTDASRGSQSASTELVLTVHSSFTKVDANNVSKTYDCGRKNCSIFVYRDHRGLADTALDTIVPLKFLPTQDVVVTNLGLKKDGAKYKAGTSVAIRASKLVTSKGQAVMVTSVETRSICSTTGTSSVKIAFRKPGICSITLAAEGTSNLDQMIKTITYIVK
jgi:hypothetical protein